MRKIQAINDHVIVEVVLPAENKTEGGLIVPLNVEMEPQKYGVVLSVGEQVKTVEVGDTLIFAKFGGQDIILNGKILKVLKLPEIYGIISRQVK